MGWLEDVKAEVSHEFNQLPANIQEQIQNQCKHDRQARAGLVLKAIDPRVIGNEPSEPGKEVRVCCWCGNEFEMDADECDIYCSSRCEESGEDAWPSLT